MAHICASFFNKLCSRLITFWNFVRCQRLWARKVADVFLFNRGISHFLRSLLHQWCEHLEPTCCWINHSKAHKVNTWTIFAIKSIWTYEVNTQCFLRSHYDQLRRYMSVLLAVSLVHFDIWLDSTLHTFPVHHGSHRLFEAKVPSVLEVVVIPTNSPVL